MSRELARGGNGIFLHDSPKIFTFFPQNALPGADIFAADAPEFRINSSCRFGTYGQFEDSKGPRRDGALLTEFPMPQCAAGFGAAGVGAEGSPPACGAAAGAGTPDFALYASTTSLVMLVAALA